MYIKLKVITSAKFEKVEKFAADEWKVWVCEEAEMNRANARVLAIMREHFPNTAIRIVNGHHSPSKIVSID